MDSGIPADTVWFRVQDLGVEGRAWDDTPHPFHRLPIRAETHVPREVWRLAGQAAGLSTRFRTDSRWIYARWHLDPGIVSGLRPDDTLLRVGGLDCYGRDGDGPWRWVGACLPWKTPDPDGRVNQGPLDGRMRLYRLYLPLGFAPNKVQVGIPGTACLERVDPDPRRPIVIYGTSIVHGSKVSRPGLAYAAILQRRLDYPVINLGFSGNGRMDRAVVDLLVEIDAAIYVIDCLPNMGPEQIRERMPLLVETVRRARPRVPILFVGDRVFGDATFIPSRQVLQQARKEVQGHVFRELRKRRIRGLHLLETANYFGDDFEGTVDGSHPNDLGSYRMANRLEPVLRRLLSRQAG